MSIKRTKLPFEKNFTQIPNHWLRDTRLSRKARGLLAEIMSHSEGWNITVESLIRDGQEGRESIRAAIKELADIGYLKRTRRQVEGGKLQGSEYVLSEPPRDGFPDPRLGRTSVKPTVGEPVHKEEQAFKEHQETKNTNKQALAKPDAPDDASRIAKYAYDETSGALKYIAIRGIAKWALEIKGASPAQIIASIGAIYQMGKPVTKTTLGQHLDGHLSGGASKQMPMDRMRATIEMGQRMEQERLRGIA